MNDNPTSTVLLVPGLRQHDPNHWQTLLQRKLPNAACVPRMAADDPDRLSCDAWVEMLDRSIGAIAGDVVLVAHSAGCAIVAHWARRHTRAIKGALLATPAELSEPLPPPYPDLDTLRSNGWLPLPRHALPFRSIVAASTNDPLGKFDRVAELAAHWGSDIVVIGALGHLNPASGFGEWPQAEDLVERLI